MEAKKKPVFELTENKTPRRSKSTSSELHRFLVRGLAPVNETLRQKAMYRGDLSDMVAQALESVDLNSVPLVAMKGGQEEFRALTILFPFKLRDRMEVRLSWTRIGVESLKHKYYYLLYGEFTR